MAVEAEALAQPPSGSASVLSRVFADTYLLYMKTYNVHWTAEGPGLRGLQRMLEPQYQALWISVCELAERIGAIGLGTAVAYAQCRMHAAVRETADLPQYEPVLHELVADHAALVTGIRAALGAAKASGDEATESLLTDRLAYHERQIWMMTRTLDDSSPASRAVRALRRCGLRRAIDDRHA